MVLQRDLWPAGLAPVCAPVSHPKHSVCCAKEEDDAPQEAAANDAKVATTHEEHCPVSTVRIAIAAAPFMQDLSQGAEERSVTSIHTRGELMTAGNARHARSK